jgi:hypothetical protein
MAGKKWELAAAVARHLVKVEPENAAWWINLAYAARRCESVEKVEAILILRVTRTPLRRCRSARLLAGRF